MNDNTSGKHQIDPFFQFVKGTQWNALIGRQGNEHNYLDGYIEAAIELASSVIDKRLYASRDTLILPILFNGRHALELTLKFGTEKLLDLEMIKTGHKRNHNIHSYWKTLHDNNIGDRGIRESLDDLEPYVESLAKIDDDGQELRYAINQDAQRSLEKYELANIGLIRSSLESMSKLLTKFRYRIIDLQDERKTETYTRDCSRSDLVDIAQTLGDHSFWKQESFLLDKKTVMMRYAISSTKFSKAVNAIRGSRPLAALVGLETPLKYIQDDKLRFVMERWSELYSTHNVSTDEVGTDLTNIDFHKREKHFAKRREIETSIGSVMETNELVDLETLFYIGREHWFGELYEEVLESTARGYKNQEQMRRGISHLLEKTNLLQCVMQGCESVGRPSLAANLRQLHLTQLSMHP